jgi:hypothetical protein
MTDRRMHERPQGQPDAAPRGSRLTGRDEATGGQLYIF